MKTGEDYIRETSQVELASGILKQAAQDLRRFHGATERSRARTLCRRLSLGYIR